MRARTFWIALPLAIVLALWLGPGLAREDVMPESEPVLDAPDPTRFAETDPTTPECEPVHDPGPDGDR